MRRTEGEGEVLICLKNNSLAGVVVLVNGQFRAHVRAHERIENTVVSRKRDDCCLELGNNLEGQKGRGWYILRLYTATNRSWAASSLPGKLVGNNATYDSRSHLRGRERYVSDRERAKI